MKNKILKFIFLLFPCLFFLTGCGFSNGEESAESKYQVVENSSRFTVNSEKFIYVYNDGEKIQTSGLIVTFDNKTLTYDEYFLTTNDESPLNGKIEKDSTLTTSNKSSQFQFFVAYQLDAERKIFVSDGITITINNAKGSTPIVYWIVTGICILAIAFVFLLRSKDRNKKKDDQVASRKTFYENYETSSKEDDKPLLKVVTEEEKKEAEEKEKNNPFITSFKKKENLEKEENEKEDKK